MARTNIELSTRQIKHGRYVLWMSTYQGAPEGLRYSEWVSQGRTTGLKKSIEKACSMWLRAWNAGEDVSVYITTVQGVTVWKGWTTGRIRETFMGLRGIPMLPPPKVQA